jgi:hypothetical protein
MSLGQWGAVIDMGGVSHRDARVNLDAKKWRIGSERKTIRDWAADPRNTLRLSGMAIKCRIWRAERKGLVLTIAGLQAPQERYSRRERR